MYADFPCKVYSTNTTRPYLRTFIVESTIKQRGSRNVVPDETTKHILMEEKQKLKKKKSKKKSITYCRLYVIKRTSKKASKNTELCNQLYFCCRGNCNQSGRTKGERVGGGDVGVVSSRKSEPYFLLHTVVCFCCCCLTCYTTGFPSNNNIM